MAEDGQTPSPFERWLSLAGNVVAPATAISALLFYFGYVSSRSQYEYFGLDVDTIGLTTQGFIMRSPQALLVPLLVLSVLGMGAVVAHAIIKRGLTSAFAQSAPGPSIRARNWIGRATAGGFLVLAAGMVLLFLFPLLRDWVPFNLITPLVIALGGSVTAYALGASRFVASLESASDTEQGFAVPSTEPATPGPATPGPATPGPATPGPATPVPATPVPATPVAPRSSVLLRPAASAFILVAVAASTLWATATVAQWSGVGLAQYQALHLDELPSVILDTKERLFLTSPGLTEVALPTSKGQTFHYRYRHLRLLIQGDDRMFLVPDRWSASNSTLLVRLDDTVRMQFQFINQRP